MVTVMVLIRLPGNEGIDRQGAEGYCRYAAYKGKIPLCPYLCFHGMFQGGLGCAVEGILASRLLEKVDEVWVFDSQQGECRRKREMEIYRRYGEKARFFCHPEIGREMLACAMHAEELIEFIDEMEGM